MEAIHDHGHRHAISKRRYRYSKFYQHGSHAAADVAIDGDANGTSGRH